MSKGKLFLAILSMFTPVIFGFFWQIAHAQSSPPINITISPLVIELSGNPGDTINSKFSLINNGDVPIKLKIAPLLIEANNNTDAFTTTSKFTPQDSPAWVTIENSTPSARPKEWLDIPYTVTIPTTAAFGHYFALEISQDNKDNSSVTQGAKLEGKVLVINLLTVRKPGLTASVTLTSFKPSHSIEEYLPVKFETILHNSGNIHLKPRGNIFISNDRNKDVGILEINGESASILPDSVKTFESFWNNGFVTRETITENDQTKSKLNFNWNKLTTFRLGRYTAKALLVYDDGTRDVPLTATTSFWVIPYTILGIMFVSSTIIISLVIFLVRSYIRKEVKKLTAKNAR